MLEVLIKLGGINMRKYLSLLVISNLLTGCIYADGCFYTLQMVNCVDKSTEFPYIAFFKKRRDWAY